MRHSSATQPRVLTANRAVRCSPECPLLDHTAASSVPPVTRRHCRRRRRQYRRQFCRFSIVWRVWQNARSHGCLYRNQRCYFGWKKDMPCSPVTPYPGTPYPKSYNAGACGAVYQKHSCIVTAWSRWGVCWGKCGGGKQFRMRRIETLPLNRGKHRSLPLSLSFHLHMRARAYL